MTTNEDLDNHINSLSDHFKAMSERERLDHNAKQLEESGRQHAEFKAAFSQGKCYLCEGELTSFDKKRPCLHWFLRPSGAKKHDYVAVTNQFGMMQIQSWIRWVANEGEWASNIADTADADHIVQVTARYGAYSWSISCGKTDFIGHGKNSQFPHYHLQMWINDRPFISYNDFHIRIHKDELVILKASKVAGVKSKFPHGESYDDLIASINPKSIIDMPVNRAGDLSRATFNLSTVLMADEGTTISGEDIYNMFERAKKEGVTYASLVKDIPNVSSLTIVSEGPGVVEPAPRTPTRGSKRGSNDR